MFISQNCVDMLFSTTCNKYRQWGKGETTGISKYSIEIRATRCKMPMRCDASCRFVLQRTYILVGLLDHAMAACPSKQLSGVSGFESPCQLRRVPSDLVVFIGRNRYRFVRRRVTIRIAIRASAERMPRNYSRFIAEPIYTRLFK